VRELCNAHDVMLILDEIQTGLGRTGKLLAEQHEGIEADVTLLGKALSGGFYPVSAVLSNNAVLGTLKPGQHGSTFGGNPLACAVARAALRVRVEEGMIENAAAQGSRFLDGLSSIRSNTIREVRGRGLMLAVELHPEAGGARRYCQALQARGILAKDTHGHTIRIAPPLVISSDQVDWALEQIAATLRQDFS
jgi:ornithine--oxo-acid transaminase